MINRKGRINGRKVTLLSMDDGYSPPKTVEQTRKLVEQDEILADIGSLGTPTNSAIQKYLNSKKVPHILISTGAAKWNDPKNFPWTTPFYPPYAQEGQIYAKYVLKELPCLHEGVVPRRQSDRRQQPDRLRIGAIHSFGEARRREEPNTTDCHAPHWA